MLHIKKRRSKIPDALSSTYNSWGRGGEKRDLAGKVCGTVKSIRPMTLWHFLSIFGLFKMG